MKLTTDFDKLGFHDASIQAISRKPGVVKLDIKGAFISKKHPGSEGQDWLVEEGILEIFGVSEEKATFWDNDKTGKSHPEPEYPLDEIMHAKFSNGIFSFDGFKQTEPWYEWFITANSFILVVKSATQVNS